MTKNNLGSKIFDWFNVIFLLIFSFTMLYPLMYVFSVSISDNKAVALGLVKLFPKGFDLTAFRITFINPEIWRAYYNTVLYSVTGTFIILLFNTMTAFPLSRKNFYGRNIITIYFTLTMFFSGGLIPTYLLISNLKMINTIWAIILPVSVGAWNIIIFRTNFQGIPESLIESVKIDGGRAWTIFFRVVLPLSKPIIATIALFSIVFHWNNFFGPLIYLNSNSKLPLQNYLRSLIITDFFDSGHMQSQLADSVLDRGEGSIPGLLESIKMAAILVSIGPILLAYPFVQKYFVRGILVGSIKG